MTTTSKPERFLATIYKIWMMRHITVPEEVSSALAKELVTRGKGVTNAKPKTKQSAKFARPTKPKYIPVVAIVNGRTSRTTLVPAGDGRHRMQINTNLRKAARADVGDVVSVELRLDLESRDLPVPADLRAALKEHPKARKAFEALAAGHRRQFIKWFDSAKAPETRLRRLTRAMDILLERAILGASRRHKLKSK
jgi:bacteriocin resistance YdeI/OmpD-like protein/uncharacterized protein DUF1905